MINSKELIDITGISRATLNNYVSLGILPAPSIRQPKNQEGRATRLGYFPREAVETIKTVQILKKQGLSISEIVRRIGGNPTGTEIPHSIITEEPIIMSQTSAPSSLENANMLARLTMELSSDHFPGPAYMLNNNFELVWWNEKAHKNLLPNHLVLSPDVESRNIISLLFAEARSNGAISATELDVLLRPHLAAIRKRFSRHQLVRLYSSLQNSELSLVESLYDQARDLGKDPIVHFPVTVRDENGNPGSADVYLCFYREGILFTYSPVNIDGDYMLDFLCQRNLVIHQLLSKREPHLSHVAVLVADLQNSVRICAELPAEEYFSLINSIWQESEPIFRKYYGTHGKHVGDGMVYYFFPQPDSDYILNAIKCAAELRQMVQVLSNKWQNSKQWSHSLHLNIGLNEGQEWFGTYHTGSHVEFIVLGETVNYASRISDFASSGAIWISKQMLSQLPQEKRQGIHYGISRKTADNERLFVANSFARVSSLAPDYDVQNPKFRDIEMMSITEIRAVNL